LIFVCHTISQIAPEDTGSNQICESCGKESGSPNPGEPRLKLLARQQVRNGVALRAQLGDGRVDLFLGDSKSLERMTKVQRRTFGENMD